MKSKYRIVRGDRIGLFILAAFVPMGGCIQTAALWTNLTGGDVTDPVFTLTQGPLLIFIDDRKNLVDQPKAIRELHKKISGRFLEYRVNHRVIPFSEWQRLKQQSDYDKLSIRQIGEKLGADQVLYIQVDRFTLHAEAGAPIFKGEFIVRVKVIATERVHDVHLWPKRESAGRRLSAETPSTPMDSEKSSAEVASELAEKMAQKIAELFYEHREFSE